MQSRAQIVHQTRDRMRLRIPGRRKDVPYFMDLYENLRALPGITDVVINPTTASVLLHFPGESDGPIQKNLQQIGLLPEEGEQEQPEQPVVGRMERFFAGKNSRATHVRTVLLVAMFGMAVHQFRRGKIFAPTVSVLWYAYDLIAAHKREKALLETTPEPPSN